MKIEEPFWVTIVDSDGIKIYLDTSKSYSVREWGLGYDKTCYINGIIKGDNFTEWYRNRWVCLTKREVERQIDAQLFDNKVESILNEG